MAAEEKTTLPQHMLESKTSVQGLDESPAEVAQSQRRRKALRWTLAGTVLVCLTLRVVLFIIQKQSQGGREFLRPHRIPPKAAEQIFL